MQHWTCFRSLSIMGFVSTAVVTVWEEYDPICLVSVSKLVPALPLYCRDMTGTNVFCFPHIYYPETLLGVSSAQPSLRTNVVSSWRPWHQHSRRAQVTISPAMRNKLTRMWTWWIAWHLLLLPEVLSRRYHSELLGRWYFLAWIGDAPYGRRITSRVLPSSRRCRCRWGASLRTGWQVSQR